MGSENILLVGFPSNGLVGTFTISYIVYSQKMPQIGEMEHPELPPALFVENGEIIPPIRIYKKENLHVITSDMPFDPFLAHDFAEMILKYCQKNKIEKIIIISGLETVDNTSKTCNVYGLVTHNSLEKVLYENNIKKFLAGSIFGTDAAIISVFRKSNIPTLILYSECHPFFPDPDASVAAISTLAKILKIKVDTTEIKKRIELLRIQNRKLMEDTLRTLQQQQQKTPRTRAPPIYR